MIRILDSNPLLAVRDDLNSADCHPTTSITTLMEAPATQQQHLLDQLEHLSDTLLQLRLTTCLAITQPTLVILTAGAAAPTHLPVADGQVIVLATHASAFAHIARSRPLPSHEQQRRLQILTHPHLATVIALARTLPIVHAPQVASLLDLTTADATRLLKHWNPVFVPAPDHKTFAYDSVAHYAITLYDDEATLIDAPLDPRQHLPEVVRRYSNHLGKINQLPVKLSDRTIVLHYLASQLPPTPMNEPQINAAILQHVAFDDYATARRDMVDLGLVMRTANGSLYQRVAEASAHLPASPHTT